jgi:hydrogenase expression/formation protein HypC
MCLGLPGKVLEVTREDDLLTGKVDFGGICRRVCLEHVPETQPGEYVLVHVGFALARIDQEEAKRIFALLENTELEGLEASSE